MQRGDPYHFTYDGANSTDQWAPRRYAWMVKHIGDIFAQVAGPGAVGPGKRFRPVLAGFGSYAAYSQGMLQYLFDVWGAPSSYIAAATIAPYFGIPEAINNAPSPTVDEIIEGLNSSITSMDWSWSYNSSNSLAEHAALYRFYEIAEFRGYEGGPATTGPNVAAALMAKAEATVDPRMTELVERLWSVWASYGLSVLNIHQAGATTTLAPWGSFGVLWDMNVPVTPKTVALDAVRTKVPPAPTAGLAVPLIAHNVSLCVGYYGSPRTPVTWLPANTTMSYLLRNDGASVAAWNVTIMMASVNSTSLIEVALGASNARILTAPNTGSNNVYAPLTTIFSNVQPGLSTLRLRVVTAFGYRLTTLDVVQG